MIFSRFSSKRKVKLSFQTGLTSLSLMEVCFRPSGAVRMLRNMYGSGVSTANTQKDGQIMCELRPLGLFGTKYSSYILCKEQIVHLQKISN